MVWKNPVGLGKTIRGEVVKFGVRGSADIQGVVGPYGKFIAIEIKTGKAIQNSAQLVYEKIVNELGGSYYLVRDEKDLERLYDQLSQK